MEKRSKPRRRISTSIVCSRFKSSNDGEEINGNMKDCCSTGFCADLNAHVKPGTVLVVRTHGRSSGGFADEGLRSLALAQVRWSQPKPAEGEVCYTTGMKYLMPY